MRFVIYFKYTLKIFHFHFKVLKIQDDLEKHIQTLKSNPANQNKSFFICIIKMLKYGLQSLILIVL